MIVFIYLLEKPLSPAWNFTPIHTNSPDSSKITSQKPASYANRKAEGAVQILESLDEANCYVPILFELLNK